MSAVRSVVRRPLVEASELPADWHPVLRRVLAARGCRTAADVEHGAARLLAPTLSGLDAAVDLLATALDQDQRVLVLGDFDADGATSCALALRALRLLGARQVDYLIPDRLVYGYGLTPEIVAVAAERQPHLLVTVDNGISSIDGVRAAREAGMRVLVTDHHLPGSALPAADAIVNPNVDGDAFPSKHLAGVGVIFYVMLALRARLQANGWLAARGIASPNLASLLDLVALGTVADVVTLDQNNRVLVEQGLRRIRAGACCPGITALLTVAGRDPARAVTADLGFAAGPRLNAAGRIDDMRLGVECLLADDPVAAHAMAGRLDALNRERRVIEAEMQAQALRAVAGLQLGGEGLPGAVCLYDPDWHPGVVGIVAARVKERVHRPVIAFAADREGRVRGSGRSIPGLHLRDCLERVATQRPGLLQRFGGHAMAAGLTLELARLEEFKPLLEAAVQERLTADALRNVVLSDGELDDTDMGLELAEQLRRGLPWGQGFPEPQFDGLFTVESCRVLRDVHWRLGLRTASGRQVEAMAFSRGADEVPPALGSALRIVYRLDINVWRGQHRLQLLVEYLEAL